MGKNLGHSLNMSDSHHEQGFIRKYIFSTDHKMVGIQYGITSLLFLLFGFGLMFLMRWQLAYPEQPIPILSKIFSEDNPFLPGGIMVPEFYNSLGAMHGAIMVFLGIVPYPGADGIFGKTDASLINEQINLVGLDRSDPNAADDITTLNQLHLPVDKPAIIHLSSKDVLHSFYLPEMRVKQDAIPGMSIPLWFKPVKTGSWEIACAQLCGLGHYRMRGFLNIHSQTDYDAWLKEQVDLLQGAPQDDFWN